MPEATLITFLGRTPKSEGQYRTTCYKWPGEEDQPCQPQQEVAFFGLDILRRLGGEIDRVVVLGTAGSMWDHLFEVDVRLEESAELLRLQLMEQVENKAVLQSMLDQLAPVLTEAWGKPVRLEIIPDGVAPEDQIVLFSELNNQVAPQSRLILDITHAYRHLPMIMLLVAMQLKQLKAARVERVLYGMYDPDSKYAQVVDLKGLLDIAEWMQALMTFDKDGDYGVFADLVDTPILKEAAFFERTTNPIKAREKLRGVREQLQHKITEDPIWSYFRSQMLGGFTWIDKPARHYWEAALAKRYLQKGDYLRSILYALESCISREVYEQRGSHQSFEDRNIAHESLKNCNESYKKLNNLRNAIAHGARTMRRDMAKALEDEQCLKQVLSELYKALLS